MASLIESFEREAPGVWLCVQPATVDLPQGRVQVAPGTRFVAGTKFSNVDVARLLDAEYRQHERTREPHILVVDDEPSMRELVRLHLTNNGYTVSTAEDAIEAGHAILHGKPDLVILGVQMPYMTGYELAGALRSDPATEAIPIVFLTTDADVGEQARRLGVCAYLLKPVTVDRLLEVVALHARRLEDQAAGSSEGSL